LSIRRALAVTVAAVAWSSAGAQTLTPLNPPPRPIHALGQPDMLATGQPAGGAQPAQTQIVQAQAGPVQARPLPTEQAQVGPLAPAPQPPGQPAVGAPTGGPQPYVSLVTQPATPSIISGSDREALDAGIAAARRGDVTSARAAMMTISDPAARKIVLWAIIDADGEALSFPEMSQAMRDFANWPRAARREMVAERALYSAGLGPQQVIAWFGDGQPTTAQGAMALASAYQQLGRTTEAQTLIKHWWRTQSFDADIQQAMLIRFGSFLTVDDHIKRVDALLYGPQGPALHAMLSLVPSDTQTLAQARMALRSGGVSATFQADSLPSSMAGDPGLALERARNLHDHGQDEAALALAPQLPTTMPNDDAASKAWTFRKQLINVALREGDFRDAYTLAAGSGLTQGVDYTEAEFYAGWLALSKLHQPALADGHFANIQRASSTPISQARAFYWRGRAAEAAGERMQAATFYGEGARYVTTFYGQLAAEKAGVRAFNLGHDPAITQADRNRFEDRDFVRAARILQGDDRDLYRLFMLSAADNLPDATEEALLVDVARNAGDQDLGMRVVRAAAQHDIVLPDRGYPIRSFAAVPGAAEPAMVFGITRQESGFDPRARSNVGARGLMQIMPATGALIARRMGEPYSPNMLDDPDNNMRMGAYFIGSMIDNFGGSYVMATAAYNAGPGRPTEWAGYCGDPRSASVDPLDFIECIPFSETRNYVMRVIEAAEVYRARLNNGVAPLQLSADLKRGAYGYSVGVTTAAAPALAAAPVVNHGP
jgi:soluble lytic murein transglycosylase